jgi:hypothetical protein
MFTNFYNDWTGRPGGDEPWMGEAEARSLYGNEGVIVVDAAIMGPDGIPRPRWVLGFGWGVRVSFYDEFRSVWRIIDYDRVDGRYFRKEVSDYLYPDATRRYNLNEAVLEVDAGARPDGTGFVEVSDFVARKASTTEFRDIDVSSFWLPIPGFGDWDALTDPGRSATETTAAWTTPATDQ